MTTNTWQEIEEMATLCEWHAKKLFSDDKWFVDVTKWQDGDFRLMIWQGRGWGVDDEKSQYREADRITFKRDDGDVIYTRLRRYPTRHVNKVVKRKVLEHDI